MGAKQSKAAWEKAGFDCYVEPVIEIAIAAKMPKPIPDNAVLLVSSQNALHILKKLTDRRDWPVMTVGDASANLARKMGFGDVISAKGNAKDLYDLVTKIYDPKVRKIFVHVSAANIRFNLAKNLRDKGFKARRDIYYQNQMKPFVDVEPAGNITHIALYSPMAAKAVRRYAGRFNKATVISISSATDEALAERYKNRRQIAKRPNEAQMIAAVLT